LRGLDSGSKPPTRHGANTVPGGNAWERIAVRDVKPLAQELCDPLKVVFDEIVEDAKAELARRGMFFEDIEELETYGNVYSDVTLSCASADLENAELQKLLSEASSSWSRLFRALAFEKLVADNTARLQDYVEVEEVQWSTRSFVRLCVYIDIDELLGKYGLGEADAGEMEKALEEILNYEAHRILQKLNEAVVRQQNTGAG